MDQKAASAKVKEFYQEKKEKRKRDLGKDEDYYKAKKVAKKEVPTNVYGRATTTDKPALKRKGSLASLATKAIAKDITKKSIVNGKQSILARNAAEDKHGVLPNSLIPREIKKAIYKKTNKHIKKEEVKADYNYRIEREKQWRKDHPYQ